ncbi:NAD-dependent epimerase/dehydratase family protein [Candidatus Woesearchaeota archaeon]|nr:NAD-dependent epimerase/dehydratase family protein [Candidatus Woesearchaeota archaeon]
MAENILVTGGAGFIGSHTVDLLISRGYKVTVLDDLSTGKKENINKEAKFIFSDITRLDIKKFKKIDAVIHCAAQISVAHSVRDPVNDASINVLGSLNLLEMCRKLGVKKFVFASTGGAIYGSAPKTFPIKENQTEAPESPYAASKKSTELYMNFYMKTYGIDCISLRYANVYGPRQDYLGEAGVIAIFINQLLRNQKPVIFGNGMQTRDFVYVEDVALANLTALNKKTTSKKINIGTAKETSIDNLFNLITRLMDKHAKPVYENPRKGDVMRSSLDIRLAWKELGWKPEVKIEDGLRRTAEWFSLEKKG